MKRIYTRTDDGEPIDVTPAPAFYRWLIQHRIPWRPIVKIEMLFWRIWPLEERLEYVRARPTLPSDQ